MAISGAENRPVCPSFRLRTKRAERQTLDTGVRPISGRYGPKSSYGRGDSGCVEERFVAKKVTFSPQLMWSQPGLTRKSKYQTWALQARGLRTASRRAVVMPAIPEPRPQREKDISLCGDYCSRLSSLPSSELFGRPVDSTLCDQTSSFVVRLAEFGETWSQAFS